MNQTIYKDDNKNAICFSKIFEIETALNLQALVLNMWHVEKRHTMPMIKYTF